MSTRGKVMFEPQETVQRIADVGMKAMEEAARTEGVELPDALIAVHIAQAPEGECDVTTHSKVEGDQAPDALAALSYACAHVAGMAKAVGIPLDLIVAGKSIRRVDD